MTSKPQMFVHVLLFGCERCNRPVVLPVRNHDQHFEGVDAGSYDLQCECGWSAKQQGALARGHWSAPWRDI
jgi:hypothetical protein